MSRITMSIAVLLCLMPAMAGGQKHPVKLSRKPPRGAIILLNGSKTDAWVHRNNRSIQWIVSEGYVEVKPRSGAIMTRQQFGDCRVHLEFNLPLMPEAKSQGRANSGVYLQGRYEIQVLDSWQNPTYARGGMGAIYGQKDPDRDAIRPPGVWQTFDIFFRAGRRDSAGLVRERPRITVYQNGILIHNDVEILETDTTRGIGGEVQTLGPILLQDHGNPVRYRNIWILGSGTIPVKNTPSSWTNWD